MKRKYKKKNKKEIPEKKNLNPTLDSYFKNACGRFLSQR